MSKKENCCTPAGQIKRYVDCVGCDRKPKQMSKQITIEHLVKFNEILGKLNTTSSQDVLINSNTQAKEKQTAVEWFNDEIIIHLNFDQRLYLKDILKQAKEMEKEQIKEAHGDERDYLADSGSFITISAEQYYNETYKKDK
jgi:hypothetical protein